MYTTLVRLFYCKAKFFEIEAMTSIKSSVREIEIEINGDKICEILGIPHVGTCVYDTKMWPQLEGFIPGQAISRLCG